MLLQNLRAKVGARLNGDKEAGFTLIELLVVMLILGILAAIALPAFFNQKSKAGDAKAKETAHSAQVAIETYATENEGHYAGATPANLRLIEPTLPTTGFTVTGADGTGLPTNTEYRVTIVGSAPTQTFSIENQVGTMSYPCTVGGTGGCSGSPGSGTWGNG
jgi:type IV pilus assembly protein PilA